MSGPVLAGSIPLRAALVGVLFGLVAIACADRRTAGDGDPDDGRAPVPGEPAGDTQPRSGAAPADTVQLDLEPVHASGQSGLEEPLREVVRTPEAWQDLWSRIAAPRIPAPEAPAVDFDSDMLIVAAMGRRNTGGYTIEVVRATRVGGVLTVEVVEASPGADCMTTQALTSPVTVIGVERSAAQARFVERSETRSC